MKIIKAISLVGSLVASLGANAFDLGDALNTANEVSKTVNQLQALPQGAPTPVPAQQPSENQVISPQPTVSPIPTNNSVEIPKTFHGGWGVTKICKKEGETQATEINKDGISGYEWHSEIKDVHWIIPDTKVEIMVVSCADGDCEPKAIKQFLELSNKGNSLTLSDVQGGKQKYVRCENSPVAKTEVIPKNTIFSCKIKNGETINLSKSGNTLEYSQGNILVKANESDVYYFSPSNPTAAENYYVSITNDITSYMIGRVSGESYNGALFDGVIISKNDKEIDSIECLNPKSTKEFEKQFNKFESYVKKHTQ